MHAESLGTLYGIGVGPGDPDLITVKAVTILKRVNVIFTAASTKNHHSQALAIAETHIPAETPVRRMSFPMCHEQTELESAWEANARTVLEVLSAGQSAAFLTLGDAMTYSTFGYLLKAVRRIAPEAPIETVPGITSYQAAAARTNTPLVEGDEALLVLSGVQGGDRFRKALPKPENVVFLKAYRNVGDIAKALEDDGRIETSLGVINCGLAEERVVRDVRTLDNGRSGYWTLILSKKSVAPA